MNIEYNKDMRRVTVLKLYPHKEWGEALYRQLGIIRWCWNHFPALRIRHYRMFAKKEGLKSLRYAHCSKYLTCRNRTHSFLSIPMAQAHTLQAKLHDLDGAFIRLGEQPSAKITGALHR